MLPVVVSTRSTAITASPMCRRAAARASARPASSPGRSRCRSRWTRQGRSTWRRTSRSSKAAPHVPGSISTTTRAARLARYALSTSATICRLPTTLERIKRPVSSLPRHERSCCTGCKWRFSTMPPCGRSDWVVRVYGGATQAYRGPWLPRFTSPAGQVAGSGGIDDGEEVCNGGAVAAADRSTETGKSPAVSVWAVERPMPRVAAVVRQSVTAPKTRMSSTVQTVWLGVGHVYLPVRDLEAV
jgi:hypothetical protein